MPHTNVYIPNSVELDTKMRRINQLEGEVKYWKKLAEQHFNDLANIPEAIRVYGFVDFFDPVTGDLILTVINKTDSEVKDD